MRLRIGFSPCPNDTFMMDALVHHKISTGGIEFDLVMEDVENLNERAFNGDLDVTKLSYHAFLHLTDLYQLLNAGSALGFGVGPLLIAKKHLSEKDIFNGPIALPGKWTTAHWLFSLAYPKTSNKKFLIFSDIEAAVANDMAIAGVIIHENRFTYAERGFVKLMDLGQYWEQKTQLPIPLGGIAVKRGLSHDIKHQLNNSLRDSIAFAFRYPKDSIDFVRKHAQEMEDEIMRKHIALYVNDFSLDLQEKGRSSISKMFELSKEKGLIQNFRSDYFV
jgi:1,4-dihydroxy-6-naphthoate synthase